MSAARTPTRVAAAPRHDSNTTSGRIANQILEELRYVRPAVARTMTAFLHERGQLHATDPFQASLATPGASMRAPSNAAAAGRFVDGTD